MKILQLKDSEAEKIKSILVIIKAALSVDYRVYHTIFSSSEFVEEINAIVKMLQKVSGWNEQDEARARELVGKLREESKDKTIKEILPLVKRHLKETLKRAE